MKALSILGLRLGRAAAAGGIWAAAAGLVLAGGFLLAQEAAVRLVGAPVPDAPVREYSWRVAAVLPTSADGYWRELRQSMREAAARYHIGLEFLGPRHPGPEHTADRILRAVAAGVDGIVCCAENAPAVVEAIRAAARAGIPVVTVAGDAPGSGRLGYVGPDPFSLGYEAGCRLYDAAVPLNIAVVLDGATPPRDPAQAGYLSGLRRAVANRRDLRLLGVFRTARSADEDGRLARLLADDRRIGAICCAGPRETLQIARLLQERGRGRDIILIGAGLLPETLQLLRQKAIHAAVASYPWTMGNDALTMLADILTGRSHPASLDSGVQIIEARDAEGLLAEFRSGGV